MQNLQTIENLDNLTEEQALEFWAKMNPVKTFTKFNAIRVDNQKLTADGSGTNPDFGKIFRIEFESDVNNEVQEVKHEIPVGTRLFPVLQRVQIGVGWVADANGVRKPLYKVEESNVGEAITVSDPTTGEVLDTGYYKDLKAKYGLKYAQALYFFLPEQNKIYRWELKGSTLSQWFDMGASPRIPTTVEIAAVTEDRSPTGMFWNTVKFRYAEPFPALQAVKLQAELMKALLGNAAPVQPTPAQQPAASLLPTADQISDENFISPEGLPF